MDNDSFFGYPSKPIRLNRVNWMSKFYTYMINFSGNDGDDDNLIAERVVTMRENYCVLSEYHKYVFPSLT